MVITAVVLLLLGPDKLPEVAHKLGSSWRALKRLQERVENEVREVIPDLPSTGDIARIARSPVNLLNQLADRVDAREASEARPADVVSDASIDSTNLPSHRMVPPPLLRPSAAQSDGPTMPHDPSLN